MTATTAAAPGRDCPLCPRLAGFRDELRQKEPNWHNAPVPAFGDPAARLLIVGLAPGMKGANRTGRPFTGDFAGDLLYATLIKFGFAKGAYAARPDDGLVLTGAQITNAVKCLPPQNKPVGAEINTCRPFLKAEIEGLQTLTALLALGRIAHDSVIRTLGGKLKDHAFAHGARHELAAGLILFDSYHCSRYNTNTGRLTPAMFEQVFAAIRETL